MSKLKLLGYGISIALLVSTAWLARANGELHTQLGAVKVELEQAQSVADKNLAAFNRVDALQKQCVEDRRVDEQQNQIVLDRMRSDLITVNTRAQQVRVVREEIFRDPTCAELAAIDIAAQCPAWANELRFSAQAINPGRSAGSPGPRANPPAGRVLQSAPAGAGVH